MKELPVPDWIKHAAGKLYGEVHRLDEATQMLCDLCSNMSESDQERIIYNAKNRVARELADWWEDHQKFDAERVDLEYAMLREHYFGALIDAICDELRDCAKEKLVEAKLLPQRFDEDKEREHREAIDDATDAVHDLLRMMQTNPVLRKMVTEKAQEQG